MKKRVLLVNKFYYRRGGDCVYMLNLEQMLNQKGHEVAVFAMDYAHNEKSAWSDYFASEVSFSGGITQKLKAAGRVLGRGDINAAFNAVLDRFKPDVVHFNNIHSYLSPKIAVLAHRRGIRTVWTMHDYKLVCPSYSCLCGGKVCEACIGGSKSNVWKRKCMKASLAPSIIAWIEAMKWNSRVLTDCTDVFICPSEFMASKMRLGGFPSEKIVTLNNFISSPAAEKTVAEKRENYYCYVGRLSDEKGVGTLLKAASTLPYKLKIAGDGPLSDCLRKKYAGNENIEFLGHLNGEEVHRLQAKARFAVVPSEWYENNPLSIIESLCEGTPVLGAEAGGIPELISETNGMTFISGNLPSLKKSVADMWDKNFNYKEISHEAMERFDAERYYDALDKIYSGDTR